MILRREKIPISTIRLSSAWSTISQSVWVWQLNKVSLITIFAFLFSSFPSIELDSTDLHPMEIKLFRHINHSIKKIKALEKRKVNPPMFSAAC